MTTLPTPAHTSAPTRGRRFRWGVVLLTSLAIAVYFPTQYVGASLATLARRGGAGLSATYADRPAFVQVVFYVHITFAGLALLIGGFQFSATIRRRAIGIHRWIGRVYVPVILLGGAAAFVMSFYSSVSFEGFFGFAPLAVLWMWTTYRGYRAIRSGDVASHRAWMIRSFALTYAAVTLRVWLLGLVVGQALVGAGGDIYARAYAPVPFLCWIPNIVIAELLIRRRGLPGLRFAATGGTGEVRAGEVRAGEVRAAGVRNIETAG